MPHGGYLLSYGKDLIPGLQPGLLLEDKLGVGRLGQLRLFLQLPQAAPLRGLLLGCLLQLGVMIGERSLSSLELLLLLLKPTGAGGLLFAEGLQLGFHCGAALLGRHCVGQRRVASCCGLTGLLPSLRDGSLGLALGRPDE